MNAYSRQLRRPQAYVVPFARQISDEEQREVDHYRHLRERFHEGPYYSVLDASASTAKKGSAARANFDPFTGMPSYSGRYQKKRRTLPKIAGAGREYGKTTLDNNNYSTRILIVLSNLQKRGSSPESSGRSYNQTSDLTPRSMATSHRLLQAV